MQFGVTLCFNRSPFNRRLAAHIIYYLRMKIGTNISNLNKLIWKYHPLFESLKNLRFFLSDSRKIRLDG